MLDNFLGKDYKNRLYTHPIRLLSSFSELSSQNPANKMKKKVFCESSKWRLQNIFHMSGEISEKLLMAFLWNLLLEWQQRKYESKGLFVISWIYMTCMCGDLRFHGKVFKNVTELLDNFREISKKMRSKSEMRQKTKQLGSQSRIAGGIDTDIDAI